MSDDSSQGSFMSSENQTLEKSEVLLLDKDRRICDAMQKLLASYGMLVTSTDDEQKVLRLMREKHFTAAVIDVDTPAPLRGLELLKEIKSISPATAVVLLAKEQTFDIATQGFRGGAVDVVAKVPQNVVVLVDRVKELCLNESYNAARSHILQDTLEVHEEFLKKLMDLAKELQQAEDRQREQAPQWDLEECILLVVDQNSKTAAGLSEVISKDAKYRCLSALNGGEAFDMASQHGFHIALISEQLPDLPWSMVAKSLQKQNPEGIILVFTDPISGPARLSIVKSKAKTELISELTRGAQLVEAIHELREAYVAKSRERYYLQVFRRDHYEFLKRYVELRQKLTAMISKGAP